MSMQDYEAEMDYGVETCDVCNRPDVPVAEVNEVDKYLHLIPMAEFTCIIEAMGLSTCWESAVICKSCLDYYKE